MSGAAKPPVAVGELLDGKYRVERVLGAGGMGVVVAARHIELDDVRAVKFMHPVLSTNEVLAERFTREAKAAVRLRGEHVTRVLDVGKLESGAPYIVMEYLEGIDLAKLIREKAPVPVGLAVDYALQAAEALSEAHAAGIVHRDVKPANLFLTTRPKRDDLRQAPRFWNLEDQPLQRFAQRRRADQDHGGRWITPLHGARAGALLAHGRRPRRSVGPGRHLV